MWRRTIYQIRVLQEARITTFHGGEIKDRETGEIISDDQKAILAKLKAGIAQHCPQILDPNNDKAVEQLLQ